MEHGEVINIDQLSLYLRVPKSTLYKLAAEGKIPSHKVGRHWRFRLASIDRWLDQPGSALPQQEGGPGD